MNEKDAMESMFERKLDETQQALNKVVANSKASAMRVKQAKDRVHEWVLGAKAQGMTTSFNQETGKWSVTRTARR